MGAKGKSVGVLLTVVFLAVVAQIGMSLWKVHTTFTPQWESMRELVLSTPEGVSLARHLQFYDQTLLSLLTTRGWWLVATNYVIAANFGWLMSGSATGLSTETAHGLKQLYTVPYVERDLALSNPTKWFHSGLRNKPWHETDELADAQRLRAALDGVRADLKIILATNRTSDHPDWSQAGNARDKGWTWTWLYGIGGWNEESCKALPRTAAVLKEMDIAENVGFAFFSTLQPGSHIQAHTGATNMRLRIHLGLDVPDESGSDKPLVRMVCGGEARPWLQNDTITFDDSFVHEAYNWSNETRRVLIVDVWHPDLTEAEKRILSSPMFGKFGRL